MNILNNFFINKFRCPPAGIYNIVYRAQFQSQRGQSLDLWLHPLWVRNEWLGCTSARRGRLLRLNSCVSEGSEILFCFCADSCQFLYINLESLSPDIELMRLGPPVERNSSLLISYADKQWTFESPLPLTCIFFKLWAMRWWDGFILIN